MNGLHYVGIPQFEFFVSDDLELGLGGWLSDDLDRGSLCRFFLDGCVVCRCFGSCRNT